MRKNKRGTEEDNIFKDASRVRICTENYCNCTFVKREVSWINNYCAFRYFEREKIDTRLLMVLYCAENNFAIKKYCN